jgi:DNA-3-methyladenine glycosylase I
MTSRLRSGRTYHDDSPWPHLELGPRDDRRYFEQLVKAIFQAGLRWPAIESRWPAFGEVFHDFDPVAVSAMTEQDVDRAAQDARIIRHHRKIGAAVECAAIVNDLIAQHGSLDVYLRSFGSPEEEIDDLQRRSACR